MLGSVGSYAKLIVSVATAVITALQPYYGHEAWYPALIAGIGAVLVYVVPNAPASALPAPAVKSAEVKSSEADSTAT
jgi:hypothetical protein